ncbi:hypothetical protein B4Q13_19170 [Lacticaseibacillus rhamnosus]
MPELPEVETVRQGLLPVLEGHVLAKVSARRPDGVWTPASTIPSTSLPMPDSFRWSAISNPGRHRRTRPMVRRLLLRPSKASRVSSCCCGDSWRSCDRSV